MTDDAHGADRGLIPLHLSPIASLCRKQRNGTRFTTIPIGMGEVVTDIKPWDEKWQILEDCPATHHNSLNSARGYSCPDPCVCPHALFLLERERVRRAAYSKERKEQKRIARIVEGLGRGNPRIPRWFSDNGPWRILDECPAEGHNTLIWARSLKQRPRCVCPRAVVLLTDYRARMSKHEREMRKEEAKRMPVVYARAVEPNWILGRCRKNLRIADLGFNESISYQGIEDRAQAKAMCDSCPIKRDCLAWAVAIERDTPGKLGGVYGGQDTWNRQGVEIRANERGVIKRVPWKA